MKFSAARSGTRNARRIFRGQIAEALCKLRTTGRGITDQDIHDARKQIKASKESGDGMALAGIIVGWIVAGLGLIVVAFLVVGFILFANSASTSSYTSPYN